VSGRASTPPSLTPALLEAAASVANSQEGEDTAEAEAGEVFAIVSRCIISGREEEYEERLRELYSLLEQQAGFREMKAYQPSTSEDDHKILLHFASAKDLAAWQKTPQCREWMQRVKPLEEGTPRAQIMTQMDMEKWEELPEHSHPTSIRSRLGLNRPSRQPSPCR